jgi:phospholipid transport system substrate-binding protein
MNSLCKVPLLTLLLTLSGTPSIVRAGDPTDQIRMTSDKLLSVVEDQALKDPAKDGERQRQLRKVVDERFDWAAMSRSAYGKGWRDLTQAQRTEFTGLFSELIEKTYMSKVESYSGEKIVYKGDKVDGAYGVVDVVIVTLRGTDIPVSYRVLKRSAEWLVYDVSIEGVSLVNNYRSQIGAILNNSSFDNLLVRLRAKIAAKAAVPSDEKAKGAAEPKAGESAL